MSWECPKCYFINDDDDKICAMCSEPRETIPEPKAPAPAATVSAPAVGPEIADEGTNIPTAKNEPVSYFISCPTSGYKTVVDSPDVTEYFCKGCGEMHPVDNVLWIVEKEVAQATAAPAASVSETTGVSAGTSGTVENNGGILVLEDVDTHFRIEIDKAGGTIGRYGKYGAAYFQSDPRGRMVSGEHCRIKYEYTKWSIEHLSRTNDTVYNGRKLEHGFEEGLRDGKTLTLANAMTFLIRIL